MDAASLDKAASGGVLRERLLTACREADLSQKALTVLSEGRDPYRIDTPAMHRAGAWLAEQMRRLRVRTPIHLRGLFYVLVASGDVAKPDGRPFVNTDETWVWLQDVPGKANRWLGYVRWDDIRDERNSAPVIYTSDDGEPGWSIGLSLNVGVPMFEVMPPSGFSPEADVHCHLPRQPYRLIGEKTSLADVLEPVARRYRATLALPAGEISDTMLYEIVRRAAADGRQTVIFYFSDCDPSGFFRCRSASAAKYRRSAT